MDEAPVHQDITLNAGRMSLALSVGGIVALLSAGVMYGRLDERVSHVERDVETRAPAALLQQGVNQLDSRMARVEDNVNLLLRMNQQRTAP